MTRRIRFSSTLVFYDAPEIVLGEDPFGACYVGLLVVQERLHNTYLVSTITPGRLEALVSGELDLRPVFTQPEERLFTANWSGVEVEEWVQLFPAEQVTEEWLPAADFLVSEFLPPVREQDAVLQADAVARNRAVIHLALGAHGGIGTPLIPAEELAGALHSFQHLLKQAFRRSVRNVATEARQHFADPDHYELEVYGFSPGSFQVHLQAKALSDLFGGASLERAFELVDAMMAAVDSPEDSLEAVQQNRGHLASAFSTLLEFVKQSNEPLSYGWTTPGGASTRRSVTPSQAASILEVLSQENELGSEWVKVVGVFTKVNTKTGSWTLLEQAGKERHGSLHEEADDLLSGVVVKEATYKLTCEEVLAETLGTGRNRTKLQLRHLEGG